MVVTSVMEAFCKLHSELRARVIVIPGAGIRPGLEEVPGKCLENKMSEAGSGNPRVFLIPFICLFIHSVFRTHLGQALCWAPRVHSCRKNISGLR